MKRIAPILLTTVLLLAGCSGNSGKETTTAVETTTVEATTPQEETTTKEESATTTEAETAEPSIAAESTADQTAENVSSKVNEKAVYMYLNDLLNSSDNPANDPDGLDITGLSYGTPEFDKIAGDYNELCQKYEEDATQKTADHFGLTVDEVNQIFMNQVMAN